jgi:hypothetical protein
LTGQHARFVVLAAFVGYLAQKLDTELRLCFCCSDAAACACAALLSAQTATESKANYAIVPEAALCRCIGLQGSFLARKHLI